MDNTDLTITKERSEVIMGIIVANMNIKMDQMKKENQELKEQLKDLKRQLSEAESEPKNQNGD